MRDGFIRDSLGSLQTLRVHKTSDTDTANILNNHLVSAFTNEDTNNIPEVELHEEL